MTKRKGIIATLATLIATIAAVFAFGTPSFASWHDTTCPVYHLGRMCIYNGYNGGGSRYVMPEASYSTNVCYTLNPAQQGALESIDYDMVDYKVYFYNDVFCQDYNNFVSVPGRYDYDQFSPNILLTKAVIFVLK